MKIRVQFCSSALKDSDCQRSLEGRFFSDICFHLPILILFPAQFRSWEELTQVLFLQTKIKSMIYAVLDLWKYFETQFEATGCLGGKPNNSVLNLLY